MRGKTSNSGELIAAAEQALARVWHTGDWNGALKKVALAAGGWGCHLNRMGPDRGLLASLTGGISMDIVGAFARHNGASKGVNLRAAAVYDAPVMRVAAEADFTDESTWKKSPFYTEFLAKVDAPYSVFAKIFDDFGEATTVMVLRSNTQGHANSRDKSILQRLLPSIRTAVMAQSLLDLRAITIAARGWDAIGAPVFFCDVNMGILGMSEAGEAALDKGDYVTTHKGALCLAATTQRSKLQSCVGAATSYLNARRSSNILVKNKTGQRARTMLVAPYENKETQDVFQCGAVVIMLDDERVLTSRYADAVTLTPAESEIGKLLLNGQSAREIAKARSVSASTVQTQIKALGAKLAAHHRGALLIALQNRLGH